MFVLKKVGCAILFTLVKVISHFLLSEDLGRKIKLFCFFANTKEKTAI